MIERVSEPSASSRGRTVTPDDSIPQDIDWSAEDPYEEVDVSDLPEWWRNAIAEFERHNLPAYRPPQFADGTAKFRVVHRLERELDVRIDFVKVDGSTDDWTVRIDDDPVGTIGRYRDADGRTVYEMESDEFAEWIRQRPESG